MKLYAFGYDGSYKLQGSTLQDASKRNPTPTCITQAKAIKILWSSWCDVIFAHQDTAETWTIEYRGTGLTSMQREHIAKSTAIEEALVGCGTAIRFFGSKMHDGLRGYVISNSTRNEIVIFATELDADRGAAALQSYLVSGGQRIEEIQMDSRGGVLVNIICESTNDGCIVHFENIEELRDRIVSKSLSSPPLPRVATFSPAQLCTDSTTATALGTDGQVYTATRDPRYSKCLGRAYTGHAEFEPVPYFSETHIRSISSGGYMSAAVSSEGELFLWGQASPGAGTQLAVLSEEGNQGASRRDMAETGIVLEDEQDEMIKCLTLSIAGEEAFVYDVAIGHGHVLVAAEVCRGGGNTRRAVLGAGLNGKGQLGLSSKADFVQDFKEILAFSDAKIGQMAATAWSTFVVTLED
jgi:hypothetical protein